MGAVRGRGGANITSKNLALFIIIIIVLARERLK